MFLIVVVGLIAAFMVTIGSTTRQISTFSILGARAWFAAGSGMERAVQAVLAGGGCGGFPQSFNLSGGALEGYAIQSTCVATTVDEAGAVYNVYALATTAEIGTPGTADYVSRVLTATVADAP